MLIINKLSKKQKALYLFLNIILILSLIYLVTYKLFNFKVYLFNTKCIAKNLLHVYCPGCGGTRAVKALLDFNIISSILYNPIVIYVLVIFLYYYSRLTIFIFSKKNKLILKHNLIFLYIGIFIIITNFILKNILAIYFNIDYLGDISRYYFK